MYEKEKREFERKLVECGLRVVSGEWCLRNVNEVWEVEGGKCCAVSLNLVGKSVDVAFHESLGVSSYWLHGALRGFDGFELITYPPYAEEIEDGYEWGVEMRKYIWEGRGEKEDGVGM